MGINIGLCAEIQPFKLMDVRSNRTGVTSPFLGTKKGFFMHIELYIKSVKTIILFSHGKSAEHSILT